MTIPLPVGVAAVGVITFAAWRFRALTGSGAVAALTVGSASVAAGVDWAALLVFFFVTSSALSRAPRRGASGADAVAIAGGDGPRSAMQVLANGVIFAAAALGSLAAGGVIWTALGAGAIATATADTWSTEVGTRVGGTPRHILTLAPVPSGTSGGITLLGSLAAVAGAVLTSTVAQGVQFGAPFAAMVIGGLAGTLADSILGATVQERRWCDTCRAPTERRIHRCGSSTRVAGGVKGFDNDAVNLTSIIIGASVTCLLSLLS
ncbi:MAG TPA: DUF92 domain-containing protein [Gemmatimonadaceae bacterium]|nr:DUF92 domain-containing protein [Gemmatimonadaceae bacterium]